ncbi:37S ribosomal protein S16, mitochondrial [Mortierella claussenii]|nr:37S ribosomal protein S16, mitochondrial [Mortierella claussenii]
MLAIKLARHGLRNSPFFHIVVLQHRFKPTRKPIEQLGTYNPIPEKDGTKAVTLNFERVKYWISVGAKPSESVARLLAKADIIPPKPRPGMPNPSLSTPIKAPVTPATPANPSA